MYEPDDDYMHEDEEAEEIPTEMWQESSWITISAFFEEKGKLEKVRKRKANSEFCVFFKVWCVNSSIPLTNLFR